MSPNRKAIIQAILTNSSLSEEKKSEVIAQILDEFDKNYPDLKYHATKNDISETSLKLTKEIKEVELKLTKEIEDVRKEIEIVRNEIKEVELKLTKEIEVVRNEIKEVELKLTKEIENVRKEIKELDIKLTKEIKESKVETIKWTAGIIFAQFIALGGLILTMFKLLH